MDKTQRSLTERLAWLGGIIDGEGCFDTGRATTPHYKQRLRKDGKPWWGEYRFARCGLDITNTDGEIIDECAAIFTELGLPFYLSRKHHPRATRPCFKLTVYGYKRLVRVLPHILPYLVGAKARQGALMLQLCEMRVAKGRNEIWTEDEHRLVEAIRMARNRLELPQTAMPQPLSTQG
jgi:hypothetical protein